MISFPFFAALLASMLHVISGPDHLAAVTPLVIESKRKAWKVGLFWGFGHLIGMLLIGVLFYVFKENIPLNNISLYSEQIVGFILIGIGIWAFYRIFNEKKKHNHPHIHSTSKEPYVHVHEHQHNKTTETHNHTHQKIVKHNILSSLGIGVVHGFAGIAHFILFLPVLSFENPTDIIQYLIGFAVGTVLAMTAYAFTLEYISTLSNQKSDGMFFKGIRLSGGLFALIIGVYWVFSVG